MKKMAAMTATLIACTAPLWTGQALAWRSANSWGGSTTHSYGATSHENAMGGSSAHVAGEGTEHTNAYGGSSAHAYGGGSEHTNAYGGTTSGAYGQGATHTYTNGASVYHPPGYAGYPAYHPPVAVPYYSSGCYGCAAAAGAVAGVAVGAAVGAAAASAPAAPTYVVGSDYATLPAGATQVYQGGNTYYVSGNLWFRPVYGANGLYYVAVPAP